MKTLSKTFILIFILNAIMWMAPQKASAQVSVNFQVFYDNLSPYGDWVFNPDYGYVWVPDVDYGFTPYNSNGYWAFTNAGWTWVSDYSWGWAPFHYGRWFYDNYYGWTWVPGSEWGPGWVSWRRSGNYYGWAPIRPGISITFAYSMGYRIPYNQWTFVRDRDFGRTNINSYYVNSSNNTTIIRNATVISNIQIDNSSRVRYNSGPSRTEVQQRSGRSIAPVAVRERRDPGQNIGKGELNIYRPRIAKNNSTGQKSAPHKVARKEDVKPANQRNSQSQRGNQERNNQQSRQQLEQQNNNNQQARNQHEQQQRSNQQEQQKRNNEQAQQQREQQNNNNQQARQQQEQQQRNDQQSKQQQDQQRNNQQNQQQRNNEQSRQQQEQQQEQQQQQQQQQNNQQARQQQEQQQNNNQQAKDQQEKKNDPKQKKDN